MSSATAVSKRHKHHIDELVTSIRSRHSSLDALAAKLRPFAIHATFNKWDYNSWCVAVAGDALVRVRLFVENNFNYIGTMGLIAAACYMHELSVWLRLFKRDRRYELVYFDQLISTQWNHYKDQKEQLLREVVWLKSFEKIGSESLDRALQKLKEYPGDSTLIHNLTSVSRAVDMLASRRFSIYSKDAQTNGCGFQAYLIETQAIPHVEQGLADLSEGRKEFDRMVSRSIKELLPKRWQWRVMA
jgi:hypothetical protein